jgi:putative acetyltransferase
VAQFAVRAASARDVHAMAELFAAVAEERYGIASEPPVDIRERAARFAATIAESVVAVADGQVVGLLHVEVSQHGFGEIGMLVDRDWRGRGVGSALIEAAIGWARGEGLHKLSLEVFAHNTAAIALYRKWGFVEEGRRVRQYRRANGELWDSIIMGLALEDRRPDSAVTPGLAGTALRPTGECSRAGMGVRCWGERGEMGCWMDWRVEVTGGG